VVARVVRDLEWRFRNSLVQSIQGAIHRATKSSRPRCGEIDWHGTIRKNLKNYQPQQGAIVVERLVGFGRKRPGLRDLILCVDQSGSMAASVVYSSVFAAILASIRSISTKFVVFDSEVVDLTEAARDPVDLLFGVQLGGGTDINRAVGYCSRQVTRPSQTIFALISDLFEGGDGVELLRRVRGIKAGGAVVICLLALSDAGAPCFNGTLAAQLSDLGVPCFACTPDLFPGLLSAALQRHDLAAWAAANQVVLQGASHPGFLGS
jgi:hypothetical protein